VSHSKITKTVYPGTEDWYVARLAALRSDRTDRTDRDLALVRAALDAAAKVAEEFEGNPLDIDDEIRSLASDEKRLAAICAEAK
jgi:hypothetical protein